MTCNVLLLHSDRTEIISFVPKILRNMVSNLILTLDGITLASNSAVRNLGGIFDKDMSCDVHTKKIWKTALFHLHSIADIRIIPSHSDAEFVTSQLGLCNFF